MPVFPLKKKSLYEYDVQVILWSCNVRHLVYSEQAFKSADNPLFRYNGRARERHASYQPPCFPKLRPFYFIHTAALASPGLLAMRHSSTKSHRRQNAPTSFGNMTEPSLRGKYSCAKIGIIARNAISPYIYNLLSCTIYPNIVFFTPKYAI